MTTLLKERNITTKLLIDDLNMWDEFDIQKNQDPQVNKYYKTIINIINQQIRVSVNWLDTDDAKEYFYEETEYQKNIFQSLENEWDDILNDSYNNIDELIETIYQKGKKKGYQDIKQKIRFTETDKLALAFAREYNFDLITNLDDDVRNQIKNVITKGVIAGEHPSKIAPQILNVAETQLEGSIFTPKRRATMIARTEVSRIQNTGILQSYVNEGYQEVKILTAEDNNVCYTCLKYAFEFNDDHVTFENRGEERIHNIHELIKGESFPPFHPLCRCTYLSVWESKGHPPEDPYVINLTPMKFLDSGKLALPDGKPTVKWTKESLRKKLSGFVDNEEELDYLVEGILDYMVNIENRNIEYLNAMDNNFNVVCNQHTLNKSNEVKLCLKGKQAAKNDGLLFVIHNHPSNNPLHSEGDILRFAEYNIKYNFVFTEERGLFILKRNNKSESTIKDIWNQIFDKISGKVMKIHEEEIEKESVLVSVGLLSKREFKEKIRKRVSSYISNNTEECFGIYYEIIANSQVGLRFISP